jgi:UDP-N-acetylmuramoyl-L-alanyl-D-glutamate--2,6-diaminopimelate ligase
VAQVARTLAGRPDEELAVVGVTGTNAKTTVTHLLAAALEAGGLPTGIIGTLSHHWAGQSIPAERTTPEAPDFFRYLRAMVDAGCRACAAEISSHALDRERVAGLHLRAATFTNLSHDHLDYHGSQEAYFEAKARLFTALPGDAAAVLNADDPRSAELARRTRGRVVTYGFAPESHWKVHRLAAGAGGNRFRLSGPQGVDLEVNSPLAGRYNASNLAAAVATAVSLGVSPERAAAGAASLAGVPGRLERVDQGQPFDVWVDYAHTEDALAHLLGAVREMTAGRVLLVFGCGGDRDRAKRPRMGAVAGAGADLVYATSDNPRSEDPLAILEEMRPGLAGAEARFEPDRAQAIRMAVENARAGDAVVIAGKGHEAVQVIGERAVPFDDRQVAAAALEERLRRGGGSWS